MMFASGIRYIVRSMDLFTKGFAQAGRSAPARKFPSRVMPGSDYPFAWNSRAASRTALPSASPPSASNRIGERSSSSGFSPVNHA